LTCYPREIEDIRERLHRDFPECLVTVAEQDVWTVVFEIRGRYTNYDVPVTFRPIAMA
jgi:predicted SpoU family rRNA methylase